MNYLTRQRGPASGAHEESGVDASLYDAFVSKFAILDLDGLVHELRGWNERTSVSRSLAAMVRLLDLAIMSDSLHAPARWRAATLAIVVEQIVRGKLRGQAVALATIEGAYGLLLRFGEARAPCPEIIPQLRRERRSRGLPFV